MGDVNFKLATPAAESGYTNVKFQRDGSGNISAELPFVITEADYTPVGAGFTNVGTPTITGHYIKINNLVFFTIRYVPVTSVASAAGVGNLTLPFTAGRSGATAQVSNESSNLGYGNGLIFNNKMYVPAIGTTAGPVVFSGVFQL